MSQVWVYLRVSHGFSHGYGYGYEIADPSKTCTCIPVPIIVMQLSHCNATDYGCESLVYILTFTTTSLHIAQVGYNTKLIVIFTGIFKPKHGGECKPQF